ncbi:MAG: tetratricopeptide repeat protein [Terriglobales bacterium]
MIGASSAAAATPSPVRSDPLTRSGFDAYYSLDYDTAIQHFEQIAAKYPDDPHAVNHLLSAVLFKELYRIGAFETSLYSNNSFLDRKQLPADPKVSARVQQLIARSTDLCERRLRANPSDLDALYARGVVRGMASTYMGLLQKAWYAALKNAKGARADHERVLELDPKFTDAKMVVGIHEYIAGSLPFFVKVLALLAGYSGSKEKGLQNLYEAGNGGGETAADAKVALVLFLRREQRFSDAITVARGLNLAYPRNYMFALEVANVLNDAGRGPEAIAAYRKVLNDSGRFFQPKLEFVAFGLGEALRGQRQYAEAVEAYAQVGKYPNVEKELMQRAELSAGEVYDLMGKRDQALAHYQTAVSTGSGSQWAEIARQRIKEPYRDP